MARRAGPSRRAGGVPRVRDSGIRGRPVHARRCGRGQRADRRTRCSPRPRCARRSSSASTRSAFTQTWVKGQTALGAERPDPARERDRRSAAQRDPRRPLDLPVRLERDTVDRSGPRRLRRVLRRHRRPLPARPRLHHRQRAEPEPVLAPAVRPERRGRRRAGVRAATRRDVRRAEGRPPALDDLRRFARTARRRQAGHRPRHPLADGIHHRPRRRLPRERRAAADHGRVRVPSVPGELEHRPELPAPELDVDRGRRLPKLVALLGTAFDGTAQHGTSLPILYDEFGIETTVPAAKASLYTGTEPATTRPVDEATQAQMYTAGDADGLLPEDRDGTVPLPRAGRGSARRPGSRASTTSTAHRSRRSQPIAAAAATVHRGVAASCPGLQLTPKLVVRASKPAKTGIKVNLTCSLDCTYTVALDRRRLNGTAVGRVATTLVFKGALPPGRHVVAARATAP